MSLSNTGVGSDSWHAHELMFVLEFELVSRPRSINSLTSNIAQDQRMKVRSRSLASVACKGGQGLCLTLVDLTQILLYEMRCLHND